MPAIQETIEHVKNIGVDQYKYGFETEDESRSRRQRASTRAPCASSRRRRASPTGCSPGGWTLRALARHDGADVGQYQLPEDRLPEPLLLRGTEGHGGSEVPRRGRSGAVEDLRETRHSAEGTGAAGRRHGPRVAVDAVFDSVSVVTTFKEELAKAGVIFCSISEAIREHPELVKKYLGSVVPQSDNFYAALNSAVFSDGSFVYVPEGVRCPMELSTYFRINEKETGQFERTLIIADKGAYVSYLEGCTAPMRDEHQLHAAVVELIALDDAEIKYSTVQNWYPGRQGRQGRHL